MNTNEKKTWLFEKITGEKLTDTNQLSNNEDLLLNEIQNLTAQINEMIKLYDTSIEGESCFR
ncbi:MAG: hypothetical protein HRU38_15745 [Saccharospirillaceae bacterium]|nr:hypothetical protein [Pseudomonadales bacterium]NRB80094.1 hypothetical protein [Saccharospirillaceae bacterium]